MTQTILDEVVLIDTQWNVNSRSIADSASAVTVLIDTQWNVNVYEWVLIKDSDVSFNRYIVECKSLGRIALMEAVKLVLIDTQWNVNHERSIQAISVMQF